jgi:hypothetical protein
MHDKHKELTQNYSTWGAKLPQRTVVLFLMLVLFLFFFFKQRTVALAHK